MADLGTLGVVQTDSPIESENQAENQAEEQVVQQKTRQEIRYDWSQAEVLALFELPFMDLLHRAQNLHRSYYDPNEIQLSTLLNIKSGGCIEDCGYCSQSVHHNAGVAQTELMDAESVERAAQKAKDLGAGRFCMGAAWRNPKDEDMPQLLEILRRVKDLGMETCMTLGMLSEKQAKQLQAEGLDYYNHNVDTSKEYYSKVVSTRSYQDRLDTLHSVQKYGMKVCTGGIIGLGEKLEDRASMLCTLAALRPHPQSVPINMLVPIEGTPSALGVLGAQARLDSFDFVRTIAVAKILMPASRIRLSAGRNSMSDEMQALCFYAGANSIFYGDKLLTTENQDANHDQELLGKLGMYSQ